MKGADSLTMDVSGSCEDRRFTATSYRKEKDLSLQPESFFLVFCLRRTATSAWKQKEWEVTLDFQHPDQGQTACVC